MPAAEAAEPMVEARCVICGLGDHTVVCTARDVAAQQRYLEWFHRRRLKTPPHDPSTEEALSDRAEFTQDYATDIVACRGCGLVYRSPRPSAHWVAGAYQRDRYGRPRLEALFEAQRELYRSKVRKLRRWLRHGRGVRVVEVGSFVGGFLAAAGEQGWEVLGVDPGEEVDAFCRERGLSVHQGTLEDAPLEPGSTDCVAVWNTFDQMPDPRSTVNAARRLLRPGGILALRVPNGECFRLLCRLMRWLPGLPGGWLRAAMAWNNLLTFPYLYGYSARTLDAILKPYGFHRMAAQPDTLPRLADDQTQRWAHWEERGMKALFRSVARLGALRPGSRLALAPWIDAYYSL